MDIRNTWLPPTTVLTVELDAGTPDEVIAGYRTLTGDAPLMPD